tara:strand:- start:1502 stop:1732 length:231 start_codon:yes stop_codon:yes gene_type:complete
MKGYKYTTEEEAVAAIDLINQTKGYPKEGASTLTWTSYYEATLNDPVFYYIQEHESLIPILGNASEFNVIEPDIII